MILNDFAITELRFVFSWRPFTCSYLVSLRFEPNHREISRKASTDLRFSDFGKCEYIYNIEFKFILWILNAGLCDYRRYVHRGRDYRFFCVHSIWNFQKIWAGKIELEKKPTSWRVIEHAGALFISRTIPPYFFQKSHDNYLHCYRFQTSVQERDDKIQKNKQT